MQLDTAAIVKDGERIGTSAIARFDFHTAAGEQILVTTAISGVSMEGAARNLAAETPEDDFDKYLAATRKSWNEQLSKIEITCDDPDEKVKFWHRLFIMMWTVPITVPINKCIRQMDGPITVLFHCGIPIVPLILFTLM